MADRNDEFYVGYKPQAPAGIAARTRRFVTLTLLLSVLLSVGAVVGFQPLPRVTFEFGSTRTFVGTLHSDPYPSLLVDRPGIAQAGAAPSRYHLVAPFKFGADAQVADFDGRRVELQGTLVHRDGQTMIELLPGSIIDVPGVALPPVERERLGEHALVGEIVDSKCFLGVMNPGNLKPHRACAVRCISGGIPPVLCVRDEEGRAEYFLLVTEGGGALNQDVLEYVALPVEIRGNVERLGEQWILRTSAEKIRAL